MPDANPFESIDTPSGAGTPHALPVPDMALLQALLDSMPARAVVVDRSHRYVYCNHEALQAFGLPREKVIGHTVAEVLGEDLYKRYLQVADKLFSGQSMRWEAWQDYPHEGRRYVQEHLQPYAPGGGEVIAIIAFGRDLTEFKLQEQLLADQLAARERAEMLKSAIVDHAMAAIVSTDAQGDIVEFNPAAEAMFGLPRAHALGRSVANVIIPERHREAHEAGMARMAASGTPRIMGRRLEMHALRADSSEFPIEMVLWRTDVAGTTYYTASINDISERQRAAEVIERQRDALRQSEKLGAMGSLLAGVAHELNNPLSIVMGRAGLLEEKAAGTPMADDARRIANAADRCGRIVRTFLSMARSKPVAHAAVQIDDLVRGAADLLQYSLRTSGITLALDLADSLPAIAADPDRLGQVVLNLVVNAQQAMSSMAMGDAKPGTNQPRHLRLSTGFIPALRGQPAQVWLRAQDSGPGVPATLRDRIFDPYFTTKPEGSGTGLGLAVSRSIAREHGGDLVLESSDHGACFCLTLPVNGTAIEAAAPPPPPAPPQPDEALRILVVDDEPEIVDLVRSMLEGAGYEVASAETGAVALALLDEARFDAIVSDLRMPDLDGAALWRAVRERNPVLARRMVLVTGDTLSPGACAFIDDTHCRTLEKPFAKSDLLAAVRAVLDGAA